MFGPKLRWAFTGKNQRLPTEELSYTHEDLNRIEAFRKPTKNAFNTFLSTFIPKTVGNGSYLDVGSGRGLSIQHLSKEQLGKTTTIEQAKDLHEHLKRIFPESEHINGSMLNLGNLFEQKRRFQTIGGVASVDCLPQDKLEEFCGKVFDRLEGGGTFFHILDLNPIPLLHGSKEMEEKAKRIAEEQGKGENEALGIYSGLLHESFHKKLKEALQKAGFSDVKIEKAVGFKDVPVEKHHKPLLKGGKDTIVNLNAGSLTSANTSNTIGSIPKGQVREVVELFLVRATKP